MKSTITVKKEDFAEVFGILASRDCQFISVQPLLSPIRCVISHTQEIKDIPLIQVEETEND